MQVLADRTRTILSGGPMKRAELIKQLGVDGATWVGVGLWVDLVRVPPSGTWDRRRADIYGLAEDWAGPDTVDEEQGVDHLIRRYLEGFGPAAMGDLVSWSGLPVSMIVPRLEAMETVSFRDTSGKELFDLPDGLLPDPATPVAGALPADLGRLAAGPLPPGGNPARAVPSARVPRKEPAVGEHLPGRRRSCRDLEKRQGTGSGGAVRAAGSGGPARGRR